VLVHLLIVWGLVVLALVVAALIERRRTSDDEKPDYAVALGFVASSYGVLLGLLVAFGSNHYADVRTQAQNEANALLGLYDTMAIYQGAVRDPAQHELVCYMRAVRDYDWPSMERGHPLQSPQALFFGDRLRTRVRSLPPTGTLGEGAAYGRAQAQVGEADTARQQLLFFTESRIPSVLWVVIYAGAFLLFMLISLHYAGRPAGRLISVACVVVLLTVVVATISVLDDPYGPGARSRPAWATRST
jgi:hypothetical protein